ncbi:MAG TPA: zf-HC2 domain-containing protein [Verrucomicrobiae bacterium]|nr:zf-HC2 domain-containing protein [Verrucomicrobiae bacterium]
MNCSQVANDLSAYVDGELTATREAEIDAHIDQCAQCRARVAELRKLSEGVAGLPKLQPQPRFLAEVKDKIRAGETGRLSWIDVLFRPYWPKVPIEALALIAVLVMAWALLVPPRQYARQKQMAYRRARPAETAAESYESAQAMTPPPAPAPGTLTRSEVLKRSTGGEFSGRGELSEPTFDQAPTEVRGQSVAGSATANAPAVANPSEATVASDRISTLPSAATWVVTSPSFSDVQREAARIAAALGGKLLVGKPVSEVSTNTAPLVLAQGALAVDKESVAPGQRIWVELPANKKEQFVSELSRAMSEVKTPTRAKAVTGPSANVAQEAEALGAATNGTNGPKDLRLYDGALAGTRDEIGAKLGVEEPTTVLEIVVIPPAN